MAFIDDQQTKVFKKVVTGSSDRLNAAKNDFVILIFFIYSVGIQAGPGFFESFRKDGVRLVSIAVIAVLSGALVATLAAYLLDIDFKLAVGLFSGALTSTPGLAAAIESTKATIMLNL